jgi:hypothetical protein
VGSSATYRCVKSQVRITQNGIKHVLRERWYAWTDARELYEKGYRPSEEELLEKEDEDIPMENDTSTSP